MLQEEVELKYVDSIHIQTESHDDLFHNASLVLTNMRMLVLPAQLSVASEKKYGRALHLRCLAEIQDCSTFLRTSKRLRLTLTNSFKIEVRFNSEKKDLTHDLLTKSFQRKAWESILVAPILSNKRVEAEIPTFSVRSAGVSGLIRKQEQERQAVNSIARDALSDLDSLMTR